MIRVTSCDTLRVREKRESTSIGESQTRNRPFFQYSCRLRRPTRLCVRLPFWVFSWPGKPILGHLWILSRAQSENNPHTLYALNVYSVRKRLRNQDYHQFTDQFVVPIPSSFGPIPTAASTREGLILHFSFRPTPRRKKEGKSVQIGVGRISPQTSPQRLYNGKTRISQRSGNPLFDVYFRWLGSPQ